MNARKRSQSLMFSRATLVNARQTLERALLCQRGPTILKILNNPANPASPNPPNTRKHSQTLMISRKRSQTLVQRSYEPTCVSRSSPILKILNNPANPASPNPPNARKRSQSLMFSRATLVNARQTLERASLCRRGPAIPKIPKNPANPAPDNPTNARERS